MSTENPHPGEYIRDNLVTKDRSLSALARMIDSSPASLSRIMNGKQCITPEMAIKLESVCLSAEEWMAMQARYDLDECWAKMNENAAI